MPQKQSLEGRRFGRLVVVKEAPKVGKDVRWECICDCGGALITVGYSLKNGATTSCGCYRKEVAANINHDKCGEEAPNWRGGRRVDKDGYVRVLVGKKKYRLEHKIVMETLLGRPILPKETVHHKNGIRTDNRPENLELWVSRHCKGQRVSDLVQWAKDILTQYEGVI
jgi:hypothetical protein